MFVSVLYREAGVDLEVADLIKQRISKRLGTGLFGGFVPVSALKDYDEPLLVSSIDGIGSKVRLAALLNKYGGLGQDIVHHCVNDIAVHGATPLFFLDYLAFNRLKPTVVDRIVASVAEACRALGVRVAGGETAEMPLIYPEDHFDVAGSVVGVVERAEVIDGSTIEIGDVVLGLPSSGLHTNGFSLIHEVFGEQDFHRYEPELGRNLGEALLEPHRCYLGDLPRLLATGKVHGLAHVTGGGIPGNLSRILPPARKAVLRLPDIPPLFSMVERRGISLEEMRHVFNMGIGMIAVCDRLIVDSQFLHLGHIEQRNVLDSHERSVEFCDDA
jgi:phosphoribosylformylglycinamidine cyclo-ligase